MLDHNYLYCKTIKIERTNFQITFGIKEMHVKITNHQNKSGSKACTYKQSISQQ